MRPGTVPSLRIDNRTLRDQVYDVLLRAIVDRHIKPGERLLLDDLAAQLNVSRTPVRDALSRLAAEELIEPNDGRGFRVTVLNADDLAHLYDLRMMCEQYAVERGTRNLTDGLLASMREAADDCARLHGSHDPRDRLLTYLMDEEFHRTIVGLADNPRLVAFFARLNISVQALRVGPSPITPEEARRSVLVEHGAILAALEERDAVRAKEAIGAHISSALSRTLRSLELSQREERAGGLADLLVR